MKNRILEPIEEVARKICVPVEEWPGNCHSIAHSILHSGLVEGTLRYGHYLGKVAKGTMFYGKPLIGHGWVESRMDPEVAEGCPSDIIIVDPTRWVFEGRDPYIFQTPDFEGEYDVGGNAFRALTMANRPVPAFNTKGKPARLPEDGIGTVMRQLLDDHVGPDICADQMFYLANLPPRFLGGFEKDIYQWFEDQGRRAFIPIDNWQLVMEG